MHDLLQLLSVILVDMILSGDNAILIAMATFSLPPHMRKSAIWVGLGLAIIIRISLTITTTFLLRIPFLQAIAGFILYTLSLRLLMVSNDNTQYAKDQSTWLGAVCTIVFADITMSLDNILAVAGVSEGHMFFIILGLMFSMLFLVISSRIISYIMDRFHSILWIGAGIIAWASGKMIAHDRAFHQITHPHSILLPSVAVMILLIMNLRNNRRPIKRFR
ncbi:membrane protein [Collibacillus ludicampi]|uniref:Membrane protein n=1 Tax=Collibacillus ludicampi TaxID=2771369 RepID=A0AAV4LKL8_9BACL|nr:YjbE family putative metal transport protein [Collibacillus ludicampi]GIM48368.1 membrane protein [Collibacillus ludicampi]